MSDIYSRPFISLISGHDHAKVDIFDETLNAYVTQEEWSSIYLGKVFCKNFYFLEF